MIEWTAHATEQLDQAYNYIALTNSKEIAIRIARHVGDAIRQLEAFPMAGRTGRVSGTRDLVIPNTPFIAAYSIDESVIRILAIYHGAQRWPEAF